MKNPQRIKTINSFIEIISNFAKNSYPEDKILLYSFSNIPNPITSKSMNGVQFGEGSYIVNVISKIFNKIEKKQILAEQCIIISDGIFKDYNQIDTAIKLINKNKIGFTFFLLDPTEDTLETYKSKYPNDNDKIQDLFENVKERTYNFMKCINGDIIYIKKQEFLPVSQTSYHEFYKSIISENLNRKYLGNIRSFEKMKS
jgi:hypothetical protein